MIESLDLPQKSLKLARLTSVWFLDLELASSLVFVLGSGFSHGFGQALV